MTSVNKPLPPIPHKPNYSPEKLRSIVLAAGSFWSAQAFFRRLFGVAKCRAGYANGYLTKVDFKEVDAGKSGFAFAVRILYDPQYLKLAKLLDIYFDIIDPVAYHHQGSDWGSQYRSGIYYSEKKDIAIIEEAFNRAREHYIERLAVEFCPLKNFIVAEENQQHYLENKPEIYRSLDFGKIDQINLANPHYIDFNRK